MLERAPEAIYLPAQHEVEVPPVSIGHKTIQFGPKLFGSRHSLVNVLRKTSHPRREAYSRKSDNCISGLCPFVVLTRA